MEEVGLWHAWPFLPGRQPHRADLTQQGGVSTLPFLKITWYRRGLFPLEKNLHWCIICSLFKLVHWLLETVQAIPPIYNITPSLHPRFEKVQDSEWSPYFSTCILLGNPIDLQYNTIYGQYWWSLPSNDFSTSQWYFKNFTLVETQSWTLNFDFSMAGVKSCILMGNRNRLVVSS